MLCLRKLKALTGPCWRTQEVDYEKISQHEQDEKGCLAIYYPLPTDALWTRIIKLHPARDPQQPLYCELIAVRLSDRPSFEAISYVWGDPAITHPLRCGEGLAHVTTNLYHALHACRLRMRSRFLWADALCINQFDVLEKNDQVASMDSVYRSAKKVLVWLGLDPGLRAKRAFTFIRGLLAHLNREMDILQPGACDPHTRHLDVADWSDVEALFNKPWFRRLWVLQEVGLARSVEMLWGQETINFNNVVEFACRVSECWQLGSLRPARCFDVRDTYRNLWRTYETGDTWRVGGQLMKSWMRETGVDVPTFLDIVATGRLFEASDPRDHIYAFLGHPLARSHFDRFVIMPDYTKSILQVYEEFVYQWLRRQKDLDLLSHVWHQSGSIDPQWPSWIPNFHQARPTQRPPRLAEFKSPKRPAFNVDASVVFMFKGTTVQPHNIDAKLSRSTLTVRGIVFDEIDGLSRILNTKEDEKAALEACIDGNRSRKGRYYDASLALGAGVVNEPASFGPNTQLTPFEPHTRPSYNRRLFVTDKVRFGIGPPATRLGDQCCVLFGCKVPFVVRKVEGEDVFGLVGECYVHEIMEGSMAELGLRGMKEIRDIVLV